MFTVHSAIPSAAVSPTQSTTRPFIRKRATIPFPFTGCPFTNSRPYTVTSSPCTGPGSLTHAVTWMGGTVGRGVHVGARVAGGGAVTVTPVAGEGVRLFARAGAIVPSQPVTQTAAETPAGGADDYRSARAADCDAGTYMDAAADCAAHPGDGVGEQSGPGAG